MAPGSVCPVIRPSVLTAPPSASAHCDRSQGGEASGKVAGEESGSLRHQPPSVGDQSGPRQTDRLEFHDLLSGQLISICNHLPFRALDSHPHPSAANCSLDMLGNVSHVVGAAANRCHLRFRRQTEVDFAGAACPAHSDKAWLVFRGSDPCEGGGTQSRRFLPFMKIDVQRGVAAGHAHSKPRSA